MDKKDVLWLLRELSNLDEDQFDEGCFEVAVEDECGHEGFCTVEITELAVAAASLIKELQQQTKEG